MTCCWRRATGRGRWQNTARGWRSTKRWKKRDTANAGWQRDLSVSHNKVGDALVAQGDGPGALEEYRKGLGIAEGLAARDTSNADWQRDLIVSLVRMSEVTGDKAFVTRALDLALALQRRGALSPRDAGMIEALRRRAAQ